ncbi:MULTISPECIES: DNA mismatch repair endonuclease MutL [Blautia]|uniref:DNA mismatch repair endonuclease MutL n=2 Tax=Lachnospiraceae TaxID=186803 RepID=UPI000CDB848A|nr:MULTISPECIES: DNA mismatch repair endonuclease MutL [Blautia]POP37483.1 DNA mismatch repair protein MutL [Blautia producta]MCB4352343.1 DNA mismatch repair endonuclease MutL [Blautia sp. RD014232]MCJ8020251.1 DNA mismatch repair endonuclease MutL [Blautia sp. NSJ-159]MCJ8043032.1 DNA mismatch repair endonuclease MutL [Blautia sp. NSJ-165]MCM0702603.1 DNA mismatch repair endonuclease MutL [Blautia sp. C3-R-101]
MVIELRKIAVLDQNTIDKIAAGEVVERPASVVKELVENAIDAGSSAITVEIKEGGISFIRVTDNGGGMVREQVPLAFLRHATSKIEKVEDLMRISSLGFRGEALSSIAAVGQVELITKTPEALTGVRYLIEGGKEKSLEEIGAPCGTTIIVRNLFFNTPVRAKFLKTAMTEAGYVSSYMEQLALSHQDISFKFMVNGQTKLHSSGNASLKDVIYGIYGRDIAREVTAVKYEKNGISIEGFAGKPVIARGNRTFENYYINGRYVKSKVLMKAIEDAYKPYMMQHKYPFVCLQYNIQGDEVDVNVHPTKMEVRFQNQQAVYQATYEALTSVLAHRELIPDIDLDQGKDKEEQKRGGRKPNGPEPFEQRRRAGISNTPQKQKSHIYTPQQNTGFIAEEKRPYKYGTGPETSKSGSEQGTEGVVPAPLPAGVRPAVVPSSPDADIRPSVNTPPSGIGVRPATTFPAPEHGAQDISNMDAEEPSSIAIKSANGTKASIAVQPANEAMPSNDAQSANETSPSNAAQPASETSPSNAAQSANETSPSNTAQPADEIQPLPQTAAADPAATAVQESVSVIPESPRQMELFDDRLLSKKARLRHRIIGQLFDTYWLVEYDEKFYIIDQHAAHEKVLYERFMKEFNQREILSQMVSPPEIIALSLQEAELLKEQMEIFEQFGFEISSFGGREYSISAVPANLYGVTVQELFIEILDSLETEGRRQTPELITHRIATAACKAAVKGNQMLSVPEADKLIDELLGLENPYHCPHGRPTIVSMTKYELEKKFKRIV